VTARRPLAATVLVLLLAAGGACGGGGKDKNTNVTTDTAGHWAAPWIAQVVVAGVAIELGEMPGSAAASSTAPPSSVGG